MDTHRIGAHAPGLAAPEAPATPDLLAAEAQSHDADAHPGLTTKKKATGAWQGNTVAVERTPADSASSDTDRKTASTIRAIAALRGVRVDPIEASDGATVWIVTRWNRTRQCDTIADLRGFLHQMGIEA